MFKATLVRHGQQIRCRTFVFFVKKALALLKNTRRLHDELESCYIPCMNFAEIEKIQGKLIAEINEM